MFKINKLENKKKMYENMLINTNKLIKSNERNHKYIEKDFNEQIISMLDSFFNIIP